MPIDFIAYPPTAERPRIEGYAKYEKLFLGDHKAIYADRPGRFQTLRYICANFAGLISRLCADLLFGESPEYQAPEGDDAAKAGLDAIVTGNAMHVLGYESALGNSFRGDAVLKLRWGKRNPESTDPEPLIEEVPPVIYFPEFDEDDLRRITAVTLAWLKRDPTDKTGKLLRKEIHTPGLIEHQLYWCVRLHRPATGRQTLGSRSRSHLHGP